MRFSLSTGKVIEVPAIILLGLTDDEFDQEIQDLISKDMGMEWDDIWENSVLMNGEAKIKTEEASDDEVLPLLDKDLEEFFTSED